MKGSCTHEHSRTHEYSCTPVTPVQLGIGVWKTPRDIFMFVASIATNNNVEIIRLLTKYIDFSSKQEK